MTSEIFYRIAFLMLLAALLIMRVYFMVKVRRSGGRLLPDGQAAQREGGRGFIVLRMGLFFVLLTFLVMYFLGAAWIDAFSFPLLDHVQSLDVLFVHCRSLVHRVTFSLNSYLVLPAPILCINYYVSPWGKPENRGAVMGDLRTASGAGGLYPKALSGLT